MTDLKIEIENRLQTLGPLRLKGEHGNYTKCVKKLVTLFIIVYIIILMSSSFVYVLKTDRNNLKR